MDLTLNPSKMETNELPELKTWIKSHMRRAFKLAMGNHLTEADEKVMYDFIDANEPIINAQINQHNVSLLQSYEEQLKAKDEVIAQWVKIAGPLLDYGQKHGEKMGIRPGDRVIDGILKHIDSLTSEVERLRAVNEELQLFRQKESTAYANLAEKNERLMELVDRSCKMLKAIQYGVTFGKIEEYQKLITDLSQSTDKP